MKYLFFAMLLLLQARFAFSQSDNIDLLVQSPDGKTVKLVWFLKNGDPAINGFDIKRKEGLGPWVKLNSAPILPGISAKKKLAIVESDNVELSHLKDKFASMLKSGVLKETDNATYLQELNKNDKEVQDINALMSVDYDVALICGFAYVDHTVTNKTSYQYGLFKQGTDVLLDKVSWNYGEVPDLNLVQEITSRSAPGRNGIDLIWNADNAKMKAAYVAGFNVYRQGIRLNEHPVTAANSMSASEFEWLDKSASSTSPNQYSISATSLFGIEGTIKPYTYNPEEHPASYKKAEVTQITSIGYYFKEGMNVQWTFPKEYERFLKGFYVEKDNMPAGYVPSSKLLPPSDRSYIDKSPSQVSGYIRVRVVAVYNDKTNVPGIEKLYNYFPLREPPRPLNTKIKGSLAEKKFAIKITWDPRINGDSLTDYYTVYMFDPVYNKFNAISEKLSYKTTSFNYTIQHGQAATYRFCVTAISKTRTESLAGDTVAIQVPSFELPEPDLKMTAVMGKAANLEWQYPDIKDLKGFRLFQSDSLIAGETVLNKSAREFTTPVLPPGKNYIFSIKAVSDNGIISRPSQPVQASIPEEKKQPLPDYR